MNQSPYDEFLQAWNEHYQHVHEWWQISADQNAIDAALAECQHVTDQNTISALRADVSRLNAQNNELRRKFDEEHDLAADMRDGFDAVRTALEEAGQLSGALDKRVEALAKERDSLREKLATRKGDGKPADDPTDSGKAATLDVVQHTVPTDMVTLGYARIWWEDTPEDERRKDAYVILADIANRDWSKRSWHWHGVVMDALARGKRVGKTPQELSEEASGPKRRVLRGTAKMIG